MLLTVGCHRATADPVGRTSSVDGTDSETTARDSESGAAATDGADETDSPWDTATAVESDSPGDSETGAGQLLSPTVVAGAHNTCVVETDGTVRCWGSNRYGESVPPSDRLAHVSIGENHACGVALDGRAICWGNDYYGQSDPTDEIFDSVSAGDSTPAA